MTNRPGKASTSDPRAVRAESVSSATRLTIPEVLAEVKVSRSTFYQWRATGQAPRCTKLPNGEIRVLRADLDDWWDNLGDAA